MAAADLTLCPDCGRSIPRDAVRGLCMACKTRSVLPGFLEESPETEETHESYGSWQVLAKAGEGAFGLVYEAA